MIILLLQLCLDDMIKFVDTISNLTPMFQFSLDQVYLLEKGVDRVQHYACGLVADADSHHSDATHIQDQAEELARRFNDLRAQLEDRCSTLETASQAVSQFNVINSLIHSFFSVVCLGLLLNNLIVM